MCQHDNSSLSDSASKEKILKELEGKKSKIIGCVGGVADDEVPVGEENGILRCGGGTV